MDLLISFIQKLTAMSIELKYLLVGIFSLWFVARPLFYLYTRGLTNNLCKWSADYYFKANPSHIISIKRGQPFPKGITPPFFTDGIWEINIYKRAQIAQKHSLWNLRLRRLWNKFI